MKPLNTSDSEFSTSKQLKRDKEGWLNLKKRSIFKSWQRYWWILSDNVLFYFASDKDLEPIRKINLIESHIQPVQIDGKENCFEIKTPEKIYCLQADNDDILMSWVNALLKSSTAWGDSTVEENRLSIKGMMCQRCVKKVKEILLNTTGASQFTLDEAKEVAVIIGKVDLMEISHRLEAAGFLVYIDS
eukprot:TRINITY_DN9470_c0_g2_i1.p1 TRINITY_DN9470_c0_g2~~TRINITY_DN9470_c0_g2_i1.p1  ORF type:complete len:199 (+),score=37.57 TRINITY_DN9470_c0_g2_i1:34-597(+)